MIFYGDNFGLCVEHEHFGLSFYFVTGGIYLRILYIFRLNVLVFLTLHFESFQLYPRTIKMDKLRSIFLPAKSLHLFIASKV